MSDGYNIETIDAFKTFGDKLNDLSDNVRDTGSLMGDMVADPGLYGILFGQIIGVAASVYCAGSREAFENFGEAIERHKEKLDKAMKDYQGQEDHATESISRFQL